MSTRRERHALAGLPRGMIFGMKWNSRYRAGLVDDGAFRLRSCLMVWTSKIIHKTASATPNKKAASTNHGHL